MTATETPTEEEERAAWQRWRLAGTTATDVAKAYTGQYGGIYGVVAEKLGLVAPAEFNDQMRRGQDWQPRIADAAHALLGLYIVGEETWCENREHPHHRATVDGFTSPLAESIIDDVTGLLEVKTRGVSVHPNWGYWRAQIEFQMHVTGLDQAVLADAVIDDAEDRCVALHLTPIEADYGLRATLLDLAETMWRHITEGTLPDPDTPSALDVVKELTVSVDPDAAEVDLADIGHEVARFADIKAAVKAVTDERDQLEALIRARLGDAKAGRCDGYRVSISAPSKIIDAEAEASILNARPDLAKTVLDRDRAKAEAPDLYEAHRSAKGARRLTVRTTS